MAKTRIDSHRCGGGWQVRMIALCIGMLAPVLVAGGCAGNAPPQQLADACQMKSCACIDTDVAWWRKAATSEPLWSATGRAYCSEGQELRLKEAKR